MRWTSGLDSEKLRIVAVWCLEGYAGLLSFGLNVLSFCASYGTRTMLLVCSRVASAHFSLRGPAPFIYITVTGFHVFSSQAGSLKVQRTGVVMLFWEEKLPAIWLALRF